MSRGIILFFGVACLAAAVLFPPAVHAGDLPAITELEALWNSSSSSGEFAFDSGMVAGRSYGRAVKWLDSGIVLDLGTFGGDSSGISDVNVGGIIVGQAQNETGQYLPAVWYPNGKMGLIDVVSTGYSSANAVNASGEVAGTYRQGDDYHAFYWTGSGPVVDLGDLGSPGAFAYDINDHGSVVGEAHIDNGALYPPARAFIWTMADGMTDLGAGTPDGWSVASFINNSGEIAGGVRESGGVSRAAFWTADGTLMEIGPDPGTYSHVAGMNEQGQIALYSYESPGGHFWSMETGLISMDSLGGNITRPQSINEQGQVVGWSRDEAGDMHAFLWTLEDGMIDLGTLGGKRSSAMGISENGLITGWSDVDPAEYPSYPWITKAVVWDAGNGGSGGCSSLEEIFTALEALVLPNGLSRALNAKLDAAADSIAKGSTNSAGGQLGAFINQVEAKTGKAISGSDAAALIAMAEGIINCLD